MMSTSHPRALLFVLALAATPLAAQSPRRIGTGTPEHLVVGPASNPGILTTTTGDVMVSRPRASFLQLRFEDVQLSAGSWITVQSLIHPEIEALDARRVASTGGMSLLHRGDAVRVRLCSGPGATGDGFRITMVGAGFPAVAPLSLCGADTRQPATDPRVARLMFTERDAANQLLYYTGTAFLIDAHGTMATAGHNLSGNLVAMVAEFHVPASLANGSLVVAALRDQYAWSGAAGMRHGLAAPAPADWGVLQFQSNTITGLLPGQAQGGYFTLATQAPAPDRTVRVTGCGEDSTRLQRNCTQQTATGAVTAVGSVVVDYRADTEVGNSGSPVIDEATGRVVAVHVQGGCQAGNAATANHGTLVSHPPFTAARVALMAGGGELRVESLAVPATAAAGTAIVVSAMVFNDRVGAMPTAHYSFVLARTPTLDASNRLVANGPQPQLVAVGVLSGQALLPTDLEPGVWHFGVWLDSFERVLEGNEFDNVAFSPILVTAPVAGTQVIEYQHTLGGQSHRTWFWEMGAIVSRSVARIDTRAGGSANLVVTAPALAGNWCLTAWSGLSGNPFVPDAFTDLGLMNLNRAPFVNWLTLLDGQGKAFPRFVLPAGIGQPMPDTYLKAFFVRSDFGALLGESDWFARLILE